MKSPNIDCYRLDNGLRVVHIRRDSKVEYCGVAVRAGSRDERADELGLAHFVEHTIFKGTQSRTANRIINHMEAVGGELNAYTTKEETYVYSVFPYGNLRRAVDLISDLVLNSCFPDSELDKEREVVAEEIDSYLDQPAEAVFDDFDDIIFNGSSLGHNILGSRSTLNNFDSKACRSFIERYYTAPNMVFFYLGPEPRAKVERLIASYFAEIPTTEVSHCYNTPIEHTPTTVRRAHDENHQAHTVMGCVIPSMYSPERYALSMLNNIIGGPGMNSRLNVALREKRGLVYSVDASTSLYSDTGLLSIYFGCNPEDNDRCRRLVEGELRRLANHPLTERQLDRARRQYLGQQIVASAAVEQVLLSCARQMLFMNSVRTADEMVDTINALTTADIAAAAQYLRPERFSSLTLG